MPDVFQDPVDARCDYCAPRLHRLQQRQGSTLFPERRQHEDVSCFQVGPHVRHHARKDHAIREIQAVRQCPMGSEQRTAAHHAGAKTDIPLPEEREGMQEFVDTLFRPLEGDRDD